MFLHHPTITATDSQSEPERIERVHRAYGYALALADLADGGDCALLADKLGGLHDHKDTLIVVWNEAPDERERAMVTRAWASKAGAGTTRVEHEG